MITLVEALLALAEHETMSKAALRLRVTQSAVSKRIAALERELGQKLVEPDGRRVRLTPFAVRLLARVRPLVGDLRDALYGESAAIQGELVVAVSESILASWGPSLFVACLARLPEVRLSLNAHSGPMAVERVRAGEAMLALVAGLDRDALTTRHVLEEPMVVIPSGLQPLTLANRLAVRTIESHSETWRCLSLRLPRLYKDHDFTLEVNATLQTFTGIAQMAVAGLGHGLVPLGVARLLGVPDEQLVRLPGPTLTRPVSWVMRANTAARPLVKRFLEVFAEEAEPIKESFEQAE
ncbi:LysR substrate-binding domain-containing protein [Acanthopleuribacter pedis]|uniref:LysR family transcriptional regulator n=1 Tax=Acanthopleuribacter pedis TaxID=442870 RepID=A0A8J7U489_9BACT|nr:LysR family transcriptional regulator [Acanthopleuribacter pedis]